MLPQEQVLGSDLFLLEKQRHEPQQVSEEDDHRSDQGELFRSLLRSLPARFAQSRGKTPRPRYF